MVIVLVQHMHCRFLGPCCDVRYNFRIKNYVIYSHFCCKGFIFYQCYFHYLYPQFKSSDICITVDVTSGVRSDSPSEASELTSGV